MVIALQSGGIVGKKKVNVEADGKNVKTDMSGAAKSHLG